MKALPADIFVVVPLAAAFLLPLLGRFRRALPEVTVFAASSLMMFLALRAVRAGAAAPGMLGLDLAGDALAVLVLLVVSSTVLLAVVFSMECRIEDEHRPSYYALLMTAAAGMAGAALARDLLTLCIFLEAAAVSCHVLTMFGDVEKGTEASFRALALGMLGTAFFLMGLAVLYAGPGTTEFGAVARWTRLPGNSAAALTAAALMLAGLGVKCGLAPFHGWLLDSGSASPPPVGALIAGAMTGAAGVPALARVFVVVMPAHASIGYSLLAVGVVSGVLCGLLALVQEDYRRLLSYSTVAQVGMMAAGIGVVVLDLGERGLSAGGALLLAGVLFHILTHALTSATLFLSAGVLEHSVGTTDLSELGGIRERMPMTALAIGAGSLSLAGVPPFCGFWSRLLLVAGCFLSGHPYAGLVMALLCVMPLFCSGKVLRALLCRGGSSHVERGEGEPAAMWVPVLLLAVTLLLVGIGWTLLYEDLLLPAVEALKAGVSAAAR